MKKGCCLGCFGFVALFVGVLTLVMYLTKPVVTASETFLMLVSSGKTSEAYLSTTKDFQTRNTEGAFTEYLKKRGLDGYLSGSWMHRKIRNNYGQVSGTVTLKDGKTMPLTVDLLWEEQRWKVFNLE